MATFDFYASPFGTKQLGRMLQEHLESAEWKYLTAAVAWVKRSGMDHLGPMLAKFNAGGGKARFAVGIDSRGSTREGLAALLEAVGPHGEVWIVHHASRSVTFHPKSFLFENASEAVALLGSGNLTGGGLYTNFELGVELRFEDLDEAESIRREMLDYFTPSPILQPLTPDLLEELVRRGDVITEKEASEDLKGAASKNGAEKLEALFGSIPIPAPPKLPARVKETLPAKGHPRHGKGGPKAPAEEIPSEVARGFVMVLQQTDAGDGQVTRGASRRSPEVFIPLAARNADPDFWGWPDAFVEDSARAGKFDRTNVQVRLGTQTISVNMMTWPVKHDFRLRSEFLRSAGDVGDILRLERAPENSPFDYYAEVVPKGTALHPYYTAICSNEVKNSDKRWGYYN